MKNNKGFVLMEAIVVISVLCIILITLYGAYSKILIDVKKQALYDNTEYIYKTAVVRDMLEDSMDKEKYLNKNYYIYCNDINDKDSSCSDDARLKLMNVKAVYITKWNIDVKDVPELEATTQKYIKSLDVTDEDTYRIIVMYNQENNSSDRFTYEYASLRFGSRG